MLRRKNDGCSICYCLALMLLFAAPEKLNDPRLRRYDDERDVFSNGAKAWLLYVAWLRSVLIIHRI